MDASKFKFAILEVIAVVGANMCKNPVEQRELSNLSTCIPYNTTFVIHWMENNFDGY